MQQPIDNDATRPAWEDAEAEPNDEGLHRPDEESADAVKLAAKQPVQQLAEEVYDRAMTPSPWPDEW